MKKAFYKTGLNQESDKKMGAYGNNTMLGTSSVIGRATNMSEAKEDESQGKTLSESNMGKLPESETEARHARGHYKMSDYFGGGQNLNKEGIMSVSSYSVPKIRSGAATGKKVPRATQ